MTTSNIGLLHEIDVHVLYPSQRCDCVRVIAETRTEAIEAAKLELETFDGCMFLPLFVHGATDLATA